MTAPDQQSAPSVSTAPAEGASSSTASPAAPLRRRRLPAHLGHARMSTVLLTAAFLAIGVLYLFVKPPEPSEAADPGTGSTSTSRSSDATTDAPDPSSPTPSAPATSEEATTPEETTAPEETTPAEETTEAPVDTTEPTTPEETEPSLTEPAPTTTAPPS